MASAYARTDESYLPIGKARVFYEIRGEARVAIFVDDCFWHGCPKCYVRPASRQRYWDDKLARNVSRDRRISEALKGLGWKTLRFGEHEVKQNPEKVVGRIGRSLSEPPVARSSK